MAKKKGNKRKDVTLFKTSTRLTEEQEKEVKAKIEVEVGGDTDVFTIDAQKVIAQAIKDGIDPNDKESLKKYLEKYIERLISET